MKISSFIAAAIALFPVFSQAALTPEEAQALATDIYIYAYPLVTMDVTKEVMTNVVEPESTRAPMGRFMNAKEYPNATFKDVTAPNADTLYSIACLDLSKEPYVLHVPDEDNRYYLMPLLSAWTDVFASPGTRTTGTKAADFVISGPHWTGKLPKGMQEYKSPTNLIWVLGRTYCTGTLEDYAKVHAIHDQYSVTPLSHYGKPYTPPEGVVNSKIDMKTPVREQVNAMRAAEYFKKFSELIQFNPTIPQQDAEIVVKMDKLGIKLGRIFELDQLNDPAIVAALEKAPLIGLDKILAHDRASGTDINGWSISDRTGVYGKDYLQRAYIAFFGLGANLPEDAIYPQTTVDSENKLLNGNNRYAIHFAKGETPPVNGFWSLTMYNNKYFFVDNSLNRYTLSPRNDLKYNVDGSLDLYIQNESPGKEKESNWLPAPKDDFVLMLRFYWPKPSIILGQWQPPAVKKVS